MRGVLDLLKLILESYGEMYLSEKHENFLIRIFPIDNAK